MNDLDFIFKMPEERELARTIVVKGEKGDPGNIGDVRVNGVSVVDKGVANIEGMITKAVNDLENYYLKSEVNNMVSAIPKFSIEVVSELPKSNISNTTVYLLLSGEESSNIYDEYIFINNSWEKLGTQKVNLSNYYNKEETDAKSVVVSSTEPTTNEKVWFKKSKNLWNNAQLKDISDYFAKTSTGFKITKTSNGRVSGTYNVDLKANTTYCISYKYKEITTTYQFIHCIWYAKDGTQYWIPNLEGTQILFTPAKDIIKVQFYVQATETDGSYIEIEDLQIEVGTEATEFQAHYEEKEIYVKNVTGAYEEFDNNKTNIITGAEVATNEYIDGKRVYVKRFDCGALPNATLKTIPIGSSNIDVVKVEGVAKQSEYTIPMPHTGVNASAGISLYVYNNDIMIETYKDRANFVCYVTVYYTKN